MSETQQRPSYDFTEDGTPMQQAEPSGWVGMVIFAGVMLLTMGCLQAMEGLVDYYRRAAGEHPDWDEYRAAMVTDKRVLIRIAIERAGPNVAG